MKKWKTSELLMAAAYKSPYADVSKILKFLAKSIAKKKKVPMKYHPGTASSILRKAKSQLKGGAREIVEVVESLLEN